MPDGLTDAEVWLWEQTVHELERLNLLTPAHIGVLRGCLMMWEQAHLAHRASEKFGALVPVKTKAGTALQSNPAMRETRLAVAELRACARELGCTPRRPPTDDRHDTGRLGWTDGTTPPEINHAHHPDELLHNDPDPPADLE